MNVSMKAAAVIATLLIIPRISLAAYFIDTFDGPNLNSRWTADNSPQNTGGTIVIVNGVATAQPTYQNCYNHLETPIDATKNFAVQVDVRNDYGTSWGPALVVYWDTTHFVSLKAPKADKFQSQVYNGSSFTITKGSLTYPGGIMATLRIEFDTSVIRFYAQNAGAPSLTYLSGLDLPRDSWTQQAGALMIIGKGYQNSAYNHPDYDNDYNFGVGSADILMLDNVSYGGINGWCGDSRTVYLKSDLNEDCYVDFRDFIEIASNWMSCTDPANSNCPQEVQADFGLWSIDPYLQIGATASSSVGKGPLTRIDMQMAQDEYRDAVFMMGPYTGGDRTFRFDVETSNGLDPNAILIQQAYYLQMRYSSGPIADPIYKLQNGILTVTSGQSSQIWVRFDTRYTSVSPGIYKFAIIITDIVSNARQVIPGTVQVWNFALPENVLPNNTYAQLAESQFSGQSLTGAVQHMKYYGLNIAQVHPVHDPKATIVDNAGNITTYNDSEFRGCVQPIIQAWQATGGNEKLSFLFEMPSRDLGMTRTDITYPSTLWNTVFHNWLALFVQTTQSLGLTYNDWVMTISDEENATTLMNFTIPLAEAIKSNNPNIRLVCNSSAKLNLYPSWAARYFNAFDYFQPNMDSIDSDPSLLTWLKTSGKTIWTYRCNGGYGTGTYQYQYYRTYAWRVLNYGLSGIGLWTYCAQGIDPWDSNDNLGYVLVYKHWSTDDIVHARRYEMYRQSLDDYRYVCKLRQVAASNGAAAQASAETLISSAITDIMANYSDTSRCDKWRINIVNEILKDQGQTSGGPAYFEDNFTYTGNPTPLNARWTSENSLSNPAGTNLTIANWGDGVAQSSGYDNLYNNIQTGIDASGNFLVESNMRGNNPSSWAPSLVVYWDTTHWIRFAQFANFGLMYNDGTGEHNISTNAACGGWSFFAQRIVFGNSTIKFYGSVGPNPGGSPVEPAYIAGIDMARNAWTKAPGALLIVGKGYQGFGYNNPDFDNDYFDPGASDYLGIDRVSYQAYTDYSAQCGDPGLTYLEADVNRDCYVNLLDLAELASQWMQCTDPDNSSCSQYIP